MADLTADLAEDQKEKLLSTLRKEEMVAVEFQDSELINTRSDALNYYDRQPYGDEQEGMSQIVTSEFADTVESTMPSMMRVFAGSESTVEFKPGAPGEEKWAQEASDYVPHVFFVQSNGYRVLYWWIKDALMYRLSGVTVDLEDYEDEKTLPVQGLPQDAIDLLKAQAPQDAEIEIELENDEATGPLAVPTFSGTITVTQKKKRVVVENIAPEDILFTPTARDQDKASFLGFRKKTTASELVELGLPWEDVQLLKSDRPIATEETQRNPSGILDSNVRQGQDDSERSLWVVVAYSRIDLEGDGVSDMYRVVYAHSGGESSSLIEVEEWDGPASLALASPILMSHVIVGRSLFDQTKDLQEIGSVLTRGMLNNQYMVNNPRPVVSDQVNLDSLIDWVPGSPIRLKPNAKPGDDHVQWLQVPSTLPEVQSALEFFNVVRENRTGIVRNNQGLDPDTLNRTTGGTASGLGMLMNAAQARQELIARTLAETAVKRMYRLVYRAIKKAATGQVQYWSGNGFKAVDPSQWPDDMDLQVNVGAGTRDAALQGLTLIAGAQEKLITLQGGVNGPFVTADNIANTAQRTQETLGYKTPGFFFQPTEKVMQQVQAAAANPPPPTPEQQIAMLKAQAEITKAQSDQRIAEINLQMAVVKAQQGAGAAQAQEETKRIDSYNKTVVGMANVAQKRDAADQSHAVDVADLGLRGLSKGLDHGLAVHQANQPKPKPNGGAQ